MANNNVIQQNIVQVCILKIAVAKHNKLSHPKNSLQNRQFSIFCYYLIYLHTGLIQLNKNKVIAWVFIMTLLISQSYAYASVPCESNGDSNSQQHDDMRTMRTMQNSMAKHVMTSDMQHSMQQQIVQQKNLAMDCCDQECSCPTGVFSSAMLTYFFTTSALNLVSKPSNFYLFSIQETFLPSLRKPPIIG